MLKLLQGLLFDAKLIHTNPVHRIGGTIIPENRGIMKVLRLFGNSCDEKEAGSLSHEAATTALPRCVASGRAKLPLSRNTR
jgi:hypothetical protein